MKTVNAVRHARSTLPALAAAAALALLGAPPVLAGADPGRMQEETEISQQRNAERHERQDRQQQRNQPPARPPGGDFAGAPRPPQDNPGGEEHRPPPGNGGGNAHYGNNHNRPPSDNDGGNWRPDYNRPPPPNVGRPGYDPDYRPGHRPGYRPPPPHYVPSLPPGYARHYWNGSPYYYSGGYWYRPWGSSYAVVGAPYGLFMPYLPGAYSTFWYGGSRYFMADSTYFLYDNARRGYVVTQSPYREDSQQQSSGSAADEQLYVYPARGQSEQQTADDRYECHRWAVDQTGYDPVDSNYDADRREEYLRALTACLTGRGYTVR